MNLSEVSNPALWPLAFFFYFGLILGLFIMTVSYVLAQRHHKRAVDEPCECGIVSKGSVRSRK